MNKPSQMNGLYPIIRRVRRPLLPVDEPPIVQDVQQSGAKPAAPEAKPVQGEATREDERSKASGE
jgi:hypothetical protein